MQVGHGLHLADPTFRKYAQSVKVAALARALGWTDPVLPQSMYIFKQPRIGGEVTSHQDSTFLFTEPRQTCLGLWLALEEANLGNGCVWGRPGSHTEVAVLLLLLLSHVDGPSVPRSDPICAPQ